MLPRSACDSKTALGVSCLEEGSSGASRYLFLSYPVNKMRIAMFNLPSVLHQHLSLCFPSKEKAVFLVCDTIALCFPENCSACIDDKKIGKAE